MSRREEVLAVMEKVRSVPVGALEAIRLLHAPEVDVDKVVAVIERDMGWTANLLRLANSSYFGCRRSVGSVREAFLRLGSKNLFHLITASAVIPILRGTIQTREGGTITQWQHSLGVAKATEKMAEASGEEASQHAITGAMIHDIGKVALVQNLRADMVKVDELVRDAKISPLLAERMILGVDHAEVGARLLAKWNLPQTIVEVVRRHHDLPDTENKEDRAVELVRLGNMAAWVAEKREDAGELYVARFLASAVERLGVNDRTALMIAHDVEELHARGAGLEF
ncbi:MAG: hypothetical protein A3K19_09270 [Lentisphaerae bacterium RIFOXYB12_FULL_65_16]|nr:MAG: hypothetical protein A3K18_14610 [Lentisphaerae bacterium RIFOXYA12_64_32]OGV90376.1 MAG: hypothetical protein A3K19_09270 [Lentisphaerae bacterium RIFOXYB12_FULL_65_16]